MMRLVGLETLADLLDQGEVINRRSHGGACGFDVIVIRVPDQGEVTALVAGDGVALLSGALA